MKIKFSEKVTFIPSWRGNDKLPENERITVELEVLGVSDLLNVVDTFQKLGIVGEVDPETIDGSKTKTALGSIGGIVPKYATVHNLQGDNGPLSVEHVVKFGIFMPLAIEILLKLAEISSPNEEERGN